MKIRACLVNIFKNTKNFILVFFKFTHCYINLQFSVFCRIKKKERKHILCVFFVVQNKKTVF